MNLIDFTELARGVPFLDHGRDFHGWDCWGLVVRAYREIQDMELPNFHRLATLKYSEAEPEFAAFRASFQTIRPGLEWPMDIILFRGEPCHVGIVVKAGLMLHVEKGLETCVEPYNSRDWLLRLIGIYRHAEITSDN